MTNCADRQIAGPETVPGSAYFGLINPAAACEELHGFEITLDNQVVTPELLLRPNGDETARLSVTRAAEY